MSKAEEILKSKKWSIEYPNYMHESDILEAMKEAMNDAFDAGIKRALWDYKNPNKDQFIKDYFGE